MHTKLYNELLNDHYQNPRCREIIKNPDFRLSGTNSTCGDTVEVAGRIEKNILIQAEQQATGCMISQAAASILAEHITDKSVPDILALEKEDMLNLIGLTLGPQRIQCALLVLDLFKKGIREYARSHQDH